MSEPETLEQVSVEQDGHILTGVGVSEDDLKATMDRHSPDPEPDPASVPRETEAPAQPERPRNEHGQFAKEKRGQKRFDQLTGEREAERRLRETAERERDDLRRQLEEARRPAPTRAESAPPTREVVASPARSETQAPEEPDFEQQYESQIGTKYQTYGAAIQAFQRDHVKWTLDTQNFDAKIRQSIEADRASRIRAEREDQEITRGRAAYPDFDAVVTAPHLLANNWPDHIVTAIGNMEQPEHIRYRLGQDPQLAERIRTADPVTAGMELAKLMTSSAVASSPASTARTVVPPPPAPYQPVAGGGTTTVPSSAELAAKGSYDFDSSGYREKRARERGVQRRW